MRGTRTAVPALAMSALVAAMLAAVLLAGCGSSPKPLTRAQLTSKADAICRKVTAKLEAASRGSSANTPQQLGRLVAKISGFEQAALGELGALVPPLALEADWKKFVAGAQTLAEDTAKLGEYTAAKNKAGVRTLISSAGTTQNQMVTIAKRNGFKDCEKVI